MLRIQRSANGRVVFMLSGRMQAEEVNELRQLLALEAAGQQVALDLRNVTLVNQDAVTFLASCEGGSITIEDCAAYIREWIERGKRAAGGQDEKTCSRARSRFVARNGRGAQ